MFYGKNYDDAKIEKFRINNNSSNIFLAEKAKLRFVWAQAQFDYEEIIVKNL